MSRASEALGFAAEPAQGVYQMGDVQARSWIVGGIVGSQHAARAPGAEDGSSQSTCARLHAYWCQRQLGFSRTRA